MKKFQDLWEKFNPIAYVNDNYSYIHDEDRRIIEILVKFYKTLPLLESSVEIGCGPNIYPLMLASSIVKSINVIEYSNPNITYLKSQLSHLDKNWQLFWNLIVSLDQDRKNIKLKKSLKEKIKINKGSIYNLLENKYDLASMFFCAESITDNIKEFILLCDKFIKSVKSNGYLVATFMENSKGYKIGNVAFPAISIDSKDLKNIFTKKTTNLKIYSIKKANKALRPGYTGMLVLTGRKKQIIK